MGRSTRFWVGFGVVSLLVAAATAFCYTCVDLPLAKTLRAHETEIVKGVFRPFSTLGESQWYLVPGVALYLIYRKKRERLARFGLYLFCTVAATGILVNVLKVLFGRARPRLLFREDTYGFGFFEFDSSYLSFPSGHTTTAFAAAAALGAAFPRHRWIFYVCGTIIALARVVLTSHYLSDILVGAWLGAVGSMVLAQYMMREPVRGPVRALSRDYPSTQGSAASTT